MNAYDETINMMNNFFKEDDLKSTIETENSLGLTWDNKLAIQRVDQCIKVIGKDPDEINTAKRGSVRWYDVDAWFHDTGVWEKFDILDDAIIHWRPERHYDFWYQTVKMDVPSDKIKNMTRISESFTYDKMTKNFTAGCHFYPASVVSAFCAKAFTNGKLSFNSVQLQYDRLIRQSIPDWKKAEEVNDISNPELQPLMVFLENYIFSDMNKEQED